MISIQGYNKYSNFIKLCISIYSKTFSSWKRMILTFDGLMPVAQRAHACENELCEWRATRLANLVKKVTAHEPTWVRFWLKTHQRDSAWGQTLSGEIASKAERTIYPGRTINVPFDLTIGTQLLRTIRSILPTIVLDDVTGKSIVERKQSIGIDKQWAPCNRWEGSIHQSFCPSTGHRQGRFLEPRKGDVVCFC